MEVSRLGFKWELELPAYTKATAVAMPNLSHTCNLHHSLWQHWILNPLSKARDGTCILMVLVGLVTHWATWELPRRDIFNQNSISFSFAIKKGNLNLKIYYIWAFKNPYKVVFFFYMEHWLLQLLHFFLSFFFCLFWAALTAYGGSQVRGSIGAAATGLGHSHSNTGSEPHLQPTPQLMATLDP